MIHTLQRKRRSTITLAGLGVALAVGCTSNEPASSKPAVTTPSATVSTPAPASTETPADPAEAAKKAAIATYLSHWKEVEKRYADKADKAGDLKKHAAAVAQYQVEVDAKEFHKRGLVTTGSIAVGNPTVVSADVDRKVPMVVISSCMDITQWKTIHSDTGEPAALPSNRLLRYVIKATVEKWEKGWVVIKDEPQGKKC